jgi:hypothetical protein
MTSIKLILTVCTFAAAVRVENASAVLDFNGVAARLGEKAVVTAEWKSGLPAGSTAFVIFGSGEGTTPVVVNGTTIQAPFGVAAFASVALNGSLGRETATVIVPMNDDLVGRTLEAVVVVVAPNGSYHFLARTGGPIIQDALS